jgi:hypothetical protein
MVALTGIERVNSQFSAVQLGLSECKHVQLVRRDAPETRHRVLACQRGASAVTLGWGLESCQNQPYRTRIAPWRRSSNSCRAALTSHRGVGHGSVSVLLLAIEAAQGSDAVHCYATAPCVLQVVSVASSSM